MSTKSELTPVQKRENVIANIKTILFYCLAMTVALGFNDLISSIFDSFLYTQHIIAKTTYVVILFGLTIFTAYYVGSTVVI